MNDTVCPNCSDPYKETFFAGNRPFSDAKVRLINEAKGTSVTAFCNRCGDALWKQVAAKVREEKESLQRRINSSIEALPVITSHSPYGWVYDVKGMVTGQSTTGTGFLSEFKSSVTDMLGAQSTAFNQKIKKGEEMCAAQLRVQALQLGANAIVATDIDYGEVGEAKGMLLVCMAGTAVKLHDTEVLGKERSGKLTELTAMHQRLLEIAD